MLSSPCYIEIPVCTANHVDPDQTPRCAASDLGLHCLPMSLLWDTLGINGLTIMIVCTNCCATSLGVYASSQTSRHWT